MRKQYDFLKSIRNPYAKRLKKQIAIRIDRSAIEYFKNLASELGIPCQNLIDLFLRDCSAGQRRPSPNWR